MLIPDPNFFPDPGSKRFRVPGPDPHQRILVYLNQKLFISSRKYAPGCSSRIQILIFYPFRIPDPRVKKALDPGSATLTELKNSILNTFSKLRHHYCIMSVKSLIHHIICLVRYRQFARKAESVNATNRLDRYDSTGILLCNNRVPVTE